MIKVGMAEQQLDGIERVPLCEKPAGNRSPPRVATVSRTEACCSIESADVLCKLSAARYPTCSPASLVRRFTLSS